MEIKVLCFTDLSHQVTKLIQISMQLWIDSYESIKFFPTLLHREDIYSWKRRNKEILSITVIQYLLRQKKSITGNTVNKFCSLHIEGTYLLQADKNFSLQDLLYLRISLKLTAFLFNRGQTFTIRWVIPGKSSTCAIPSIKRESSLPTGARSQHTKRKNQLMSLDKKIQVRRQISLNLKTTKNPTTITKPN